MKTMDFETEIPVQIHRVSRNRVNANMNPKLKLNITTGSVELEKYLNELDNEAKSLKKERKSMDTSLDSGLKKKSKRGYRMLLELKTDLGPKFDFPESQSGNLRSKYGRLQKVNETAGYISSDVFRMKKSPQKSLSPTKPKTVQSPPKPKEAIILPPPVTVDIHRIEEAMDVDFELLLTKIKQEPGIEEQEQEQSHPNEPPTPIESSAVVKLEKLESISSKQEPTMMTPPVAPPIKSSRRISIRRQYILDRATPATPPPPIPLTAVVKQEPSEVLLPKEALNGVFMSPSLVETPKFTAIKHMTPGMLIWGSFGKYPPWPCMICRDPNGLYMRQLEGKNVKFLIYVRFFGPKGLSSWIAPSQHIIFEADNISTELREGDFGKKAITEKVSAELNWAIEDAQIVAAEPEWEKREEVFKSILEEQFNRWKSDKIVQKAEAVKRRRSSVGSNQSRDAASSSSSGSTGKKRIKLSTPVGELESSHSFSSAVSTTSSSGVSTMGKLSDTLSVSSAGLGSDEETAAAANAAAIAEAERIKKKKVVKVPAESLEERLTRILKAIPADIVDMRKSKQEELCRNCTRGSVEGVLHHCTGSCGGLYHEQCLDKMAVSLDRLKEDTRARKQKKKPKKSAVRSSPTEIADDDGIELEEDGDEDEGGAALIVPHVTGDSQLSAQPVKTYKCKACRTGDYPACFICHEVVDEEERKDATTMTRCTMANCGRAFHVKCLEKWPQTKNRKDGVICPYHQCHLCISDDPRSQNFKQRQRLYKCIFCPTAYHLDQNCMPAGTEIVGGQAIICQRHYPLVGGGGVRVKQEKIKEEENNNVRNGEVKNENESQLAVNLNESQLAVNLSEKKSKKATAKRLSKPLSIALNVNWCFICARGGSLLCCDQCPSAFHRECLKLGPASSEENDETFICEECELGRFPLYGELVWAKFGCYRWWPSMIVSEGQIPITLTANRRNRGEFCIKFLGCNDYAWIGRRRVFLYHNDDALMSLDGGGGGGSAAAAAAVEEKSESTTVPQMPTLLKGKKGSKEAKKAKGKKVEKKEDLKQSPINELMQLNESTGKGGTETTFRRSLLEARVLNEMLQQRKRVRQLELSKLMRPVPYYKLKTNRVVPPVKLQPESEEDIVCKCQPIKEPGRTELVACGPSSNCLNRLLMTECNPASCPAAEQCDNQRLQRRQYPELDILRTEGRGWGLIAKHDLKEGSLIVEYVGELINNAEMRRRIVQKEAAKSDVYYFLTLTKDLIIDAERKGNMARFMNHSCDPNCVSEKWTVNGNTRVGLFARQDIKKNTELTFNYHWESTGTSRTACMCGAKKCKGFIGGDSKKS